MATTELAVLPDIAGAVPLVQRAQKIQPELNQLVQTRLQESGTITVIVDDVGMTAANAQVAQIVQLRNTLAKSVIREAADQVHALHRTLTGWLNAWDSLLEAREKSLSRAIVARQDELEAAVERERKRKQREAEEEAQRTAARLRAEAEEHAKKELAQAHEQRTKLFTQLYSYFDMLGEEGKRPAKECRELAELQSTNINQVRQDVQAAEQALDSLGRGNLDEALSIMKFSKESPPPPPAPVVLAPVVPKAVFVREPPPLPSSVRAARSVPHFQMICEHDKANASRSCENCRLVDRQFLVLDEAEVKRAINRLGPAIGGTAQAPNTTAIPGLRVWWEREASTRRT
jgi:hypothetical protein